MKVQVFFRGPPYAPDKPRSRTYTRVVDVDTSPDARTMKIRREPADGDADQVSVAMFPLDAVERVENSVEQGAIVLAEAAHRGPLRLA